MRNAKVRTLSSLSGGVTPKPTTKRRRWMKQHAHLSQLNLQAHQSVMGKTDNYVLEAMVTFDKVEVLIHELLVSEL